MSLIRRYPSVSGSKGVPGHRRTLRGWLLIIAAAIIFHLVLFIFFKIEYLEIFREEMPGVGGGSGIPLLDRPFSLVPLPESSETPAAVEPAAPADEGRRERSLLDRIGEPALDIEPLSGGGPSGGSDEAPGPDGTVTGPVPLYMYWPPTPEGVDRKDMGTVELLLFVDERGSVEEIRLARGLPDERLNEAAVEAASNYRFVPGTKKGVPAEMWIRLEIRFQKP